MASNIKPLRGRVLIRPLKEEEKKTESGIIIPDTFKDSMVKGEVVAIGSGHIAMETGVIIPIEVKEGDTVLYGRGESNVITVDGEELLMMLEHNIDAVI